jgi:hypothetical protein
MSQSSMFEVEKHERTGNELRIWTFFVLPLFSFGFSYLEALGISSDRKLLHSYGRGVLAKLQGAFP